MTPLAPVVAAFFRKNLAAEKGVSKNTIASYSYAFKFLCRYVSARLGKTPSELSLEDLDARVIRDFLEHLEQECGNTPRTRNLRLSAIRSFMKYVEYEVPSALASISTVLGSANAGERGRGWLAGAGLWMVRAGVGGASYGRTRALGSGGR
ncbi:MAG: hypothetical protein GEU90_21355 [Gemmatimonas sp.]|nr:hypothetical protein [Gemmatimonas sp.]